MFGKTTRNPRRLGRLRRLAPARHQTYRHLLQHELLEDRRLLATLVDTVDDVVNSDDGMISLREALMDEPSEGTINFAPALNGLTIQLEEENGELMITKPLTIDASSLMNGVTIDAQGNSRVFNINDETADLVRVEIVGMTITGGSVDGNGGGILSTEDLTLTNSTVSGNTARGHGGGIYASGDVTLTRSSTVSGNTAGDRGGGIIASGDVTLTESTVMSNSADGYGGGIFASGDVTLADSTVMSNSAGRGGGGIFSAYGGDVTLTESTVSGNSAGGRGGGIDARSGFYAIANVTLTESSTVSGNTAGGDGGGISSNNVTLTESTVSGNSAGGHGGGIFASGDVTLTNSTVSGNLAGGGGGGIYASDIVAINYSTVFENTAASGGGGIGFSVPNPAEGIPQQLTINHSIVARNEAGDGTGPDFIAPENLTVSYSLIGDNTDTTLTEAQTPDDDGNLVGDPNNSGGVIDPKLEPLADNGGPTMTHALQTDSPAIDAGDPDAVAGNGIPEFDQRGTPFSRVVDGDGDGNGNARIDMGAYELFLPVTISGFKWNDLNGDGVWDDDEEGLDNWTILLDSDDGTVDQMTTTNGNGFYEFTDLGPLAAGQTYVVSEDQTNIDSGAWTQTFGNDGYVVDATSGNSLDGTSGVAADGNFGNFQNITISGYKWNDLNGDGVWDDDEEGLDNWTILLDSDDGTVDQMTTTNGNGFYEFTDLGPLAAGQTYVVSEDQTNIDSGAWTQTFGNDGYVVDATSGNSLDGTSGVAADGNFGNFQNITISGYKWNDLNGDGVWDDDEEGLDNWTILLDSDDGTVDQMTTTNGNGFYEFTDLGPLAAGQTYVVSEDQTNIDSGTWTQTFGNDGYVVDATSGNSLDGTSGVAADGNFGNFQNITISGYKWNDLNGDGVWDDDEEGLDNWTVLLDSDDGTVDQMTTTDGNGFYEFTDLGPLAAGQTYVVSEDQTNIDSGTWTQTFGNDGYVVDATSGNSLDGTSGVAADGNFGNFQNITISGYKWNDLNGDGVWDDDEEGLDNWTILLDSDDGTVDQMTTTDGNGFYEFTDLGPLAAGQTYVVSEDQTNIDSGEVNGNIGNDGYVVDATSGNSLDGTSGVAADGNFGNFQNITISGYKWNDLNGDGVWDDDEEGLDNWTILLDSDDGTVDQMTTTDGDGFYEFTDLGPLAAGQTYVVSEDQTNIDSGTWTQTFGNDGYVVDATSGNSLDGTSGVAADGNFGNFQNITISGYKWNDLNGDGVWDDDEEGLDNWTILLDSDDGTVDQMTTTDGNGFYEFTDLGPLAAGQTYVVSEDQTNIDSGAWTQTFGNDGYVVDATSGNSLDGTSGVAADGNFGNFQNITISGYKWNDLNGDGVWDDDEEGLDNWTILLDSDDGTVDQMTTTDGNGFYEFTDLGPLAAGETYVVSEDQTDIDSGEWTQTFGNDGYVVDATSGNSLAGTSGVAEDGNFGNFQNITISGYKWDDLNGDGVWNDGEEGLENWTILLDSDRDGLPDEMVPTGSDGRYEFTNLGPGSYRVTEQMQRGWTNTYDGSTTIMAVSGVDHVASFETTELLNFGNFQNATISGYKWDDIDGNGIWDEEEPGLEGWTIQLDSRDDGTVDQIATTNGDGFYEFTDLGPGSYAISEQQQTGWTNTYNGRTTVDAGSGAAHTGGFEMTEELNFGNFQNITISGYKWEDTDGDGRWDEGELGLEGWTIELDRGDDGTVDQMTTTDGDGFYKFTDLGPGSYAISERLQTGWTNTYDGSTTVEAESGVDPAGQFETTEPLNFGNLDGNVTGIKFEDIDKNAERDSGEPIIEGWQIRAYQDDGNRFLEQSEFDAGYVTAVLTDQITGRYTMNLEPGDYILVELLWSGWAQSAPIRPVLALNLDTGGVPLGLGGHAITVVAGEAHIDQDFGNYQCPVDQNCVGCCVVDPDPPETDFGDAPTSYGDASHTITVGGPILGSIGPDAEVGSQYTANADGDDINGTAPDDEDGVTVPGFVQNVAGNFVVSGTAGAVLDAWADLNGDGSFGAGEQIATNMVLTGNPQMISATFSSTGTTYARFRVSHADGDVTGPEGLAGNGEVEDYVVFVGAGAPSDFGDAPATYGDAEHVIGAVILGAIGPDSEGASQPTANANGDDTNGTAPDDEDGVTVPAFVRNVANNFVVTGTSNAFLDAWADLNGDGDFNDPGEQIATNFVLTGGADIVPATFTSVGTTYARFRVSAAAGDVTGPTGTGLNAAANGEVEDYVVNVVDGTTTMTMRRFLASFFGNSPGTSGRGTSGSGTSDSVTSDSVTSENGTSDSVTSDSVTSGTGIPTSDSVFAEESSSQPDSELPRTANEPVETPATVATAADTVANGSMSRRVLLASSISSPLVVSPVTSATEAPASSTVDSTPVNPLSGSPAGVPASGSVDAIMAEFGVTPSSPAATPGSQQQEVPDETSDQVSAPLITSPVPVTSSPDSVGRVVHVVRFRSYNSASSHREREAETPVIRPSEPQLVTNEAASPSEDALRSLGSARTRLRPSAWAAVGERSVQSNVPVDPDNAFEFNDDPLAGVDLAIAEEFSAE